MHARGLARTYASLGTATNATPYAPRLTMLTHSSLLQSLDGAMVVRMSGRAQRCNCHLAAACRPRGRRKSRAGVSERSCAACVRGMAVRLVPAVCVGVRRGGGGACAGSAVFSGRAAIARTCGASPLGNRMSDVACGSEHQNAYNAWVVPALRVSISIAAPAGVCCSSHSLTECAPSLDCLTVHMRHS